MAPGPAAGAGTSRVLTAPIPPAEMVPRTSRGNRSGTTTRCPSFAEPTAMIRRPVLAVALTLAALTPAPGSAQEGDAVKTKAGVPLKIVVRRDTSVRADPDPMA